MILILKLYLNKNKHQIKIFKIIISQVNAYGFDSIAHYKTRFTAINDIISYIELYYNQTRIQKGLGYKTPRQVWFDFYRQAA